MTFQRVDIIPTVTGPNAPETQPKDAGATPATPAPSSEPAAAPSVGDRPSWLPEKFKSPEEMAKAYGELEKKQSGKLDQIPPPAPVIDLEVFNKEYSETGSLSEDSYKALESKGIPKQYVQAYIDGAKALAEQQINSLTAEVGGREAYTAMIQWASQNLAPEQVEAYNKAVSAADPAQQALAIRGLHAQYKQAAGPSLLAGRANGGSAHAPFQSWSQVKEAMSNPKYAKDPAYRAEVTERLRNSKGL